MINDQTLKNYLANNDIIKTTPMNLPLIGNQGENLINWQVQFNHLTPAEMYNQYKQLVNKLMFVEMEELQRLKLMAEVLQVAERLIAILRQLYQNQVGVLDDKQQQALDMVLSVYYLGIMFYQSVWQRVAQQTLSSEKKGLTSLFGISRATALREEIIRSCVHTMLGLLRKALFEKQVGYRKDTQLIWHYLNACYHFAMSYGWQNLPSTKIAKTSIVAQPMSAQFYQCLFVEAANPYSLRRPDILQLQSLAPQWATDMQVHQEAVQPPFLFINLQGSEPPQLLHAGVAFNPYDNCETCLFLKFEQVEKKLSAIANQVLENAQQKSEARLAKIVLECLHTNLQLPETLNPVEDSCQAVIGFSQIHYMLANKTSLGNLIQAHALPERLRPHTVHQNNLNKSTTVDIIASNNHQYRLHHLYEYLGFEYNGSFQGTRTVESNPISQVQVKSLIALRKPQDTTKTWYLGQIVSIEQHPADNVPQKMAVTRAGMIQLDICATVNIIGSHLVPCGVRIQNDDHRPLRFVPAFIVPNNAEHTHQTTSLLMARLGYHVNDKLIIRIDNKEVNVRLTELLRINDDVEEYAFVRIQ